MQEVKKQNLKLFQIILNSDYIQIVPQIPSFKTQILINKNQQKGKQFPSQTQQQIFVCSLILGVLKIKQSNFLLFVQHVYHQPKLPPNDSTIYQIASIGFLPFKSEIQKQQQPILETLKKQIFNFGFYFSFDYDLTIRSQIYYSNSEQKRKSINSFFWNQNLLNNLTKQNQNYEEWKICIIQGYYGKFDVQIGDRIMSYVLICRRSKNRCGTRFYSRGIDQNGNCSNFIETEQLVVVGKQLISIVFISGSSPIFWQQKSQTKPIKLTRNKQLTKGPFVEHMKNLKSSYQNIFLFNLLEKKKHGENLLIKAYEQMLHENAQQINQFCRYVYFDINQILKKKNYEAIIKVVKSIQEILHHFSCFQYSASSNKPISKQSGVFRISCLDCLNRTNIFMQVLAIKGLQLQLQKLKIAIPKLLEDFLYQQQTHSKNKLHEYLKKIWSTKASYQSFIYTGTKATSGLQNKFLGKIDSSLISLQRFYNQKFSDRLKQTSINLLHGNKIKYNIQDKNLKTFKICIFTWNVNAAIPDKLNLQEIVNQFKQADLIVFGVQQMLQLQPNTIVLEQEQSKISSLWFKLLKQQLDKIYEQKYIYVEKIQMVGICLIIFINKSKKDTLKTIQKDTVKTGMGGSFGNKGAVIIRINIYDTSICFACAHLAAGETKIKERFDDIQQIHKKAFQQSKQGIQNQLQIKSSDYIFFFGDLNFRIEGQPKQFQKLRDFQQGYDENNPDNKQQIHQLCRQLIEKDQLILHLSEMKNSQQSKNENEKSEPNQTLGSYSEQKIQFLPTYKFQKQTGYYVQNRNPSWCDRILFWFDDPENYKVFCEMYTSLEIDGSDHKPLLGKFIIQILKQQPINDNKIVNNDLSQKQEISQENTNC